MSREYVLLCRILDRAFLSSSQDWMIESKGIKYKPQKVQLDKTGRKNLNYTLYRFDLEENNFLPFFNKSDDSPEGLRKFCDYVLLVELNSKPYVFLIEMKRGTSGDAEKQLKASQTFMEFLYSSAERICNELGDESFNRKNIVIRKIKLKECKSPKLKTKGAGSVDLTQEFISFYSVGIFPIARFIQ